MNSLSLNYGFNEYTLCIQKASIYTLLESYPHPPLCFFFLLLVIKK